MADNLGTDSSSDQQNQVSESSSSSNKTSGNSTQGQASASQASKRTPRKRRRRHHKKTLKVDSSIKPLENVPSAILPAKPSGQILNRSFIGPQLPISIVSPSKRRRRRRKKKNALSQNQAIITPTTQFSTLEKQAELKIESALPPLKQNVVESKKESIVSKYEQENLLEKNEPSELKPVVSEDIPAISQDLSQDKQIQPDIIESPLVDANTEPEPINIPEFPGATTDDQTQPKADSVPTAAPIAETSVHSFVQDSQPEVATSTSFPFSSMVGGSPFSDTQKEEEKNQNDNVELAQPVAEKPLSADQDAQVEEEVTSEFLKPDEGLAEETHLKEELPPEDSTEPASQSIVPNAEESITDVQRTSLSSDSDNLSTTSVSEPNENIVSSDLPSNNQFSTDKSEDEDDEAQFTPSLVEDNNDEPLESQNPLEEEDLSDKNIDDNEKNSDYENNDDQTPNLADHFENKKFIDAEVVESHSFEEPKLEPDADQVLQEELSEKESLKDKLNSFIIKIKGFLPNDGGRIFKNCLLIILFFILLFVGYVFDFYQNAYQFVKKIISPTPEIPIEVQINVNDLKSWGVTSGLLFGRNQGSNSDKLEPDLKNAFYFGTLSEPAVTGETGITPAYYYGLLADIQFESNQFITYVNNLRLIQEIYNVNVYDMLDQTTARAEKLLDYIEELKASRAKSQTFSDQISVEVESLSVADNSLSADLKKFQDDFFVALENMAGEKADFLLKSFIDSNQKHVALKARIAALQRLKQYYVNALKKLDIRIVAIDKNREPLIQGIHVVDVPGNNLDIIIKQE